MARSPAKLNHPIRGSRELPELPAGRTVNFDILSDFEKEEIRKEARAKLEAREKDAAMRAFLDAEIARLDKEAHPDAYEEEKEITLDGLAPYADRIVLDGRHYMFGRTYTVKKSVYDVMQEIMWRTRRHYEEVHRDPAEVMMRAQQEISKAGDGYARVSAANGRVTRF